LWYDAITTVDTTVKTFTDVTTVEWSDGYIDITYSDDYDVTSTSQSVSGWTNDCEVTGPNDIYSWTGFGDWCIADGESGDGNDDDITFTLTETKTVKILAETLLTCDGWPGNSSNGEGDYGDPYVYLYDSNNNLIESDDDDGCTCGNNCPDEGNCWDSLITRELTAGTYTVKARVYSVGTGGWYKLTIDSPSLRHTFRWYTRCVHHESLERQISGQREHPTQPPDRHQRTSESSECVAGRERGIGSHAHGTACLSGGSR
jgi:hypothetical protein